MEETLMTWEEFVAFALSQGWQKIDEYKIVRKMRDNRDELSIITELEVTIDSSRRKLIFDNKGFDHCFQLSIKSYEKAYFVANSIAELCGEWID